MNKTVVWYKSLRKPSWAPPSYLFGPVWTVLYILIAISYGYVGQLFFTQRIPFAVLLPFILNLIFNLAFSPIEFGAENLKLAAVDTLLILGTLIWALVAVYSYVHWISFINIPYLLWVCFATILQLTITSINK